ncbi:MAG: TonB-dependent receptor [Bacteroidota bacterium]
MKTILTFTACMISLVTLGGENVWEIRRNNRFENHRVKKTHTITKGSSPVATEKQPIIRNHLKDEEIPKKIREDREIPPAVTDPTIRSKDNPENAGKGKLTGIIKDEKGQPLFGVTVRLLETSFGEITGTDGAFSLNDVPAGTYTLEVSYLGFEKITITVEINENQVTTLNRQLKPSVGLLDELVVVGESEAALKAAEPLQITVLESKELIAQPLGAQDLIKRSTGVQIREQGGLGSNVSINLNGLTGRAVRIFYDGIPIEFLGNGLVLNALPIGLIDRVDIYKGVAPVDVATDALGGVINIIPRKITGNYLEVAYQVGSFNTHRASLIAKRQINPKLTLGLNGFYNYSDNDYLVRDVTIQSFQPFINDFGRPDSTVVEEVIDARRFHDTHESFAVEGQADIYDIKWADRLSVVLGYNDRFDEIQHGLRLGVRPFGEVETSSNQWVGFINYSKRIRDRWDISQKSSFSYTKRFTDDSTSNSYDWSGNLFSTDNLTGAEIGRPTNRRGTNFGTSHRSTVQYSFNQKHNLVASNFFGYNEVSGEDPYGIRVTVGNDTIDPNREKSSLSRNIFGLQYEANWLKGSRLTSTVFYKNYHVNGQTVNFTFTSTILDEELSIISINRSYHGGGAALKYEFNKRFFLRTSYERTIRIPNISEFFGNFITIAQNQDLLPERGHNGNLGINFKTNKNGNFRLNAEFNAFFRDQQDRIRLFAPSPNFSQFINDQRVLSKGVELTTKVWPIKNLKFDVNFTYQRITLEDQDDFDESTIGFDLPNVPNLFFNTSASYTIPGFLSTDGRLNFFWNYFYVDRFSISLVKNLDNANPENIVPVQHDHRIGLSYSNSGNGLTFSASLNNVFDRTLFDDFKLPKPSRNIMFKILYKLNRKT